MNDVDLILLKKENRDEASRIFNDIAKKRFEKQQEEKRMLIDICNRIADSVTADEYNYWCARKDQFFKEGAEAVQATITNDIAEGSYPEETFPWTRDDV